MGPNKVILLACGSFNPPTYMHLRMFEIARDHLHRLGTHAVIGGVISPVHDSYGKKDLESSTHRLSMLRLALQNHDWVTLSSWECKQETWSRTRQVLQHYQNQLNAVLNRNDDFNINEDDLSWIPHNVRNSNVNESISIKLLCGADLLESFGTPGLWSDEDISYIVGQHGLVVITRAGGNPAEFIYNSDMLTKYLPNITIVTEWIRNEISSTKIRRALRRSESVKYLLHDKVIDYISKFRLYGSDQSKYLLETNANSILLLTPSPSDVKMESPNSLNCMNICNNNLFVRQSYDKRMSVDTIESFAKLAPTNNQRKHPGQAIKIVTTEHKLVHNEQTAGKEVCKEKGTLSESQNYRLFNAIETPGRLKRTNAKLKECKSCDENLIKFIFTQHGIEVISDVETIV